MADSDKKLLMKILRSVEANAKAIADNAKMIADNAKKIDQLVSVVGALQKDVGQLKVEVKQNGSDIKRIESQVKQNGLDVKRIEAKVKQNGSDIKRIETKLDANIKLTEYAHELIQLYHGKTPPPPPPPVEDDDLLNERYVLGLTVKELFDDAWAKRTLGRIQKRFPSKTNRKLRVYIAVDQFDRIRDLLARNDDAGVLDDVVAVSVSRMKPKRPENE